MRLILNIIWLVLCGWWMAIAYALAGLICFVLIITIPFGIAAFRIAGYVLWPFGRSIEPRQDAGVASLIGNIIWIILIGWWLAIGHVVSGITLCLTIIGIPLGLANFKMIPISLMPLGVQIVPSGQLYPGAKLTTSIMASQNRDHAFAIRASMSACSTMTSGRSSGIQWPERSTTPPVACGATARTLASVSPPRQALPPNPTTGMSSGCSACRATCAALVKYSS